jgi:hypothetical protein
VTRYQLECLTRRAIEGLTPSQQQHALLRATGQIVIVWDYATCDTLTKVYGSARAVAMLHEMDPWLDH